MRRSKSGLFLMELLINLLLFCLLCVCSLSFFVHSHHFIQKSTTLHQAVSITSSLANLYESGDGSFSLLCETYQEAKLIENAYYLYLDETYQVCEEEDYSYIVHIKYLDRTSNKIQIDFFGEDSKAIYSIQTCNHSPLTLRQAKEAAL